MYVRNVIVITATNQGGPECVKEADNNISPGGEDLIATPGSAV